MQLTCFDTLEHPPDVHLYTHVNQLDNNTMVLGSMINSMYDQQRLTIDPVLDPVRIKVPNRVNDNSAYKYIYGVQLQPNKRYLEIVNRLTSVPVDHPERQAMYQQRAKLYGLSCDDCWALCTDNIFPLNKSNIDTITINSPYTNQRSSIYLKNEQQPWFSQYTQPKIFILKTL